MRAIFEHNQSDSNADEPSRLGRDRSAEPCVCAICGGYVYKLADADKRAADFAPTLQSEQRPQPQKLLIGLALRVRGATSLARDMRSLPRAEAKNPLSAAKARCRLMLTPLAKPRLPACAGLRHREGMLAENCHILPRYIVSSLEFCDIARIASQNLQSE
jgi:hypothetical protein